MPITRTPWIDDDGSGTTGTVINNAAKQEIYNQIDATAAFVNQANTFAVIPQIVEAPAPQINIIDTLAAANARVFNIWLQGGALTVRALNDAQTIQQSAALRLDRAGHIYVEGNLFEKSRANPIGHWIDQTFNAANYFSDVGSWTVGAQYANSYTLVGKTLTMSVWVNGTVAGNPARLYVALPPGYAAGRQHMGTCPISGPSTVTVGTVEIIAGATRIGMLLSPGGSPWPAGSFFVGFTISFSIQ